jgi:hypothetical protein
MISDKPKNGETWYFLVDGAVTCRKGIIVDQTEKTTKIKHVDSVFDPSVYALSKITFVERVGKIPVTFLDNGCDND